MVGSGTFAGHQFHFSAIDVMAGTIIWQTILKNPYKFLHPNIDDKYFEYLLDSQLKILVDAMKA
ncbi:MAG: hypothetical protein ACTSQF_01750 [Candidatus Heimdallarchaeaceae archaeon]